MEQDEKKHEEVKPAVPSEEKVPATAVTSTAAEQPPVKKQGRGQWIAIYILLGVSAALSIFIYIENMPPPAHLYDALAKCIAETSTTFYGAFWCPHCAEQKT